MGFWPLVEALIRKSDIVVLVIDARMPELSRNESLEKKVARLNKPLVIACNKIDLADESDLSNLRKNHSDWHFVSGARNIGISKLKIFLMIMGKKMGIKNPQIGIVGYPNVGKSAIINALAHRARTSVSSTAGTTRGIQWVKAGGLDIIDSPGVIPSEDKDSELGLIAAKNPEKIANPEKVASRIISLFLIKNPKRLQEYFKLSDEQMKNHSYEIMVEIGRKRGFLSKGGIVDETKTAIQIIREWQKGKLGFK